MSNPQTVEDDPESLYSQQDYRACAIFFLSILQPAIAHVSAAKTPDIGYAQIMFALGLEDRSMRDVAAGLRVEVACISKGARAFVKANNLPIPNCMRSDAASESYRASRESQLKAG